MTVISVKQLCSGYDKNQVIHSIDFAAKNEITAIVGANGSGKSTLLKSIFGLCDVTSGSISLNGVEITGTPTHNMMRYGISYMPQRQNVFSELTLYENLAMAGLDKKEISFAYDTFSELKPYNKKKANTLSGGQRQLLAMAMVSIKKPKVMLFDEPTANLSPKNAQYILDKIQQIQHEQKNCIILVEQNVRRALSFCDTVYLLASGTVVYCGKPQTLLHDVDLTKKYLGV